VRIAIVEIVDRGVANKERLWLKVLANADLCYFVVFDTTYTSPNSISNRQRHAYWFAPKQVAAGDHVILYTRDGAPTEKRNPDGSTTHFFYWGLNRTVWNSIDDCAVLLEINSWQTSKYRQ